MTNDDRIDPVDFAERMLALLDIGSFTMSYKRAVLLGLLDCRLEGLSQAGEPPSALPGRSVGDHSRSFTSTPTAS